MSPRYAGDRGVDGRADGVPNAEITTLYLINRILEDHDKFKKLSSFPIDVHVLIAKTSLGAGPNSFDQFVHIVWATLYDNLKDAHEHRIV